MPSRFGYSPRGDGKFSITEITNEQKVRDIAVAVDVRAARKITTALNRHPKPLRQPNQAGSVYFEPDADRWRGEMRVNGRRRRVSGTTKSEARTKLRALMAEQVIQHGI